MEYLKRLEESLVLFEESADKLSQVPQLLKGIIDLTNEIQKENAEISKTYSKMEEFKRVMEKQTKEICDYIDAEKKTRDEFITAMKNTLIQNNKENIEVYNSLSTTISHKVEMVENKLDVAVSQGVEKVTNNIAETNTKLEEKFEVLNTDVKEIKNTIPLVLRTQILVIVSIAIGIVACILQFV